MQNRKMFRDIPDQVKQAHFITPIEKKTLSKTAQQWSTNGYITKQGEHQLISMRN